MALRQITPREVTLREIDAERDDVEGDDVEGDDAERDFIRRCNARRDVEFRRWRLIHDPESEASQDRDYTSAFTDVPIKRWVGEPGVVILGNVALLETPRSREMEEGLETALDTYKELLVIWVRYNRPCSKSNCPICSKGDDKHNDEGEDEDNDEGDDEDDDDGGDNDQSNQKRRRMVPSKPPPKSNQTRSYTQTAFSPNTSIFYPQTPFLPNTSILYPQTPFCKPLNTSHDMAYSPKEQPTEDIYSLR
jgi:hypothetical protein